MTSSAPDAAGAQPPLSRVIFAVEHGCLVLLHGFLKKTRTTPTADLALARRRRGGHG